MEDDTNTAALRAAGERAGVDISPASIGQLNEYIATLLLWRTRISLTTASTPAHVIEEHLADSLAVIPQIPPHAHLADIGSGAGFPGLVVAMVRPDVDVLLIESRRKRCSFLREVIRQTRLGNARVIEGRVESLSDELAGKIDVTTARALGSVAELVEISRPLLRPGGHAIAMKGPRGREEAIEVIGFRGPNIRSYDLGRHGTRFLISYEKLPD